MAAACAHNPIFDHAKNFMLVKEPLTLQSVRDLNFEPALDEGIREIVVTLIANGVEAFESCEGGQGHSYAEPTVCFLGSKAEGLRALSVAIESGFNVKSLSQTWSVIDQFADGPFWELRFWPPAGSPQWGERDTTQRYLDEKATRVVEQRVANVASSELQSEVIAPVAISAEAVSTGAEFSFP